MRLQYLALQCLTLVRHISPTNDQWALQQIKMFHRAERLVPDLHYSTSDDARFYVVLDNRSVVHVRFDAKSLSWSAPVAVASLQFPSSTRSADPYPESLLFPDREHAFFANGAGFLSVYSTGDRANPAEWQLLSSFILEKDGLTRLENFDDLPTVCPFVLADVRFTGAESRWDLLANCVYEKEELDPQKERAKTTWATRLYWATLQKEAANGEFAITRQREVIQDGHMELATLDKRAENIVTIGGRKPVFVSDSLHPVEEELPDGKPDGQIEVEDTTPMVDTHGNMKPIYVWTQDAEELSASFRLEEDVTRSDIDFSVLADTLTLKVKGKTLLSGKLEGMVHVDTSTWTLDKNVLDITLFKVRGHFWRELVVGDKRGHYEADPKVMQQIAETLEKFSTSDDNALPSGGGPSFNSEQLEEVDTDEYEFTYVSWINGVSHAIEHLADISGHQLIFTGRLSTGGPVAFATRHDVDGVVWSLDSESELVKHAHTLNAFGYVQ
ncbi:NudC domain-containing protein 1, partial [Aphelenchoides avenae]